MPSHLGHGFVGQRIHLLFCSFVSSGHALHRTLECWDRQCIMLRPTFIKCLTCARNFFSHVLTFDLHSFPVKLLGISFISFWRWGSEKVSHLFLISQLRRGASVGLLCPTLAPGSSPNLQKRKPKLRANLHRVTQQAHGRKGTRTVDYITFYIVLIV